jgi:hypothetical protein
MAVAGRAVWQDFVSVLHARRQFNLRARAMQAAVDWRRVALLSMALVPVASAPTVVFGAAPSTPAPHATGR